MSEQRTLEQITCLNCDTSNAGGRDFCSECGKSLWFLCPACNHRVSVSEKFCGKCGANVKELRDKEAQQVQDRLSRMKSAASSGNFVEAIRLCRYIAACDPERFSEAVTYAKERLPALRDLQAKADERLVQSFQQAKQRLKENDYEQALAILIQIPEALRTEEVLALLSQTEAQIAEIERLRKRIPQAIKENPLKAFGDIAALVRLQPNELKAKKLGEQLRDQVLKRAQSQIKGQKFAEAHALLGMIPAEFNSELVDDLLQQAEEAIWFEENLKQSPFVDENLVDCAKRFAQLASSNPKSKSWLEQAQTRWGDARQKPPGFAPWAAVKQSPVIGSSLKMQQPVQGFKIEGVKVPGGPLTLQRFSVALGLALQAIGNSPISSVFGKEKKGLMSKLGFKAGKAPDTAWGIDVGATAVKAVQLTKKGNEVSITDLRLVELDRVAPQTRSALEWRETVRGALTKLRDDAGLKGKPCLFSVDSSQILARFIRFPSSDEKKLGDMIEAEAKHGIPFPLDDVDWYWHRFPTMANGSVPVVVLAMRKDDIDERMELLRHLDFQVLGAQSNAVALFHQLRFSLADADEEQQERPRIVLDVGAEGTQMVVANHERLWFRTLSHGGSKLTMAIGRTLKLPFVEAEKVKLQPFSQAKVLPIVRCVQTPISDLVREIERSSTAAEKEGFQTAKAEVLLTGGASRGLSLARTLIYGAESDRID